jgi:cytochrome c
MSVRMRIPMKKMIQGLVVFVAANAGIATAQDVSRGKKLYEECIACHVPERGVNNVGPSLHGVFGRAAGEGADFRYSPAMKRSGISWNADTLNAFITDPQKVVPGNRMPYSGMVDAKNRADLIAYLQSAMK